MSTEKLDPRKDPSLQPATALWTQYHPESAPFRFQAAAIHEAQEWQITTRQALNEQIGFQDMARVDPNPQILETVDRSDHTRYKISLQTARDIQMPLYLLIPKDSKPPYPVVIAFHGHGYGVKDIVGLWENGEERYTPDGYHKDFGIELCRRGFAVAAPEISCFGERQTDFNHLNTDIGAPVPSTCDHTAKLAFHLGGSVIGLRVFDAKRLVDYLETRQDLDTDQLGAMGISGGGMHTFFSTALDERIKACVISGYYSTFRDSILAMSHCTCNFVPGLYRFGEMYDLIGLIAPRPVLIEAGSHDSIFPIEAVKDSVHRARQIYTLFNAQNQLETDFFEGRHAISGRRAYDFLWQKLARSGF
jgi:dienelactone hydrolase